MGLDIIRLKLTHKGTNNNSQHNNDDEELHFESLFIFFQLRVSINLKIHYELIPQQRGVGFYRKNHAMTHSSGNAFE